MRDLAVLIIVSTVIVLIFLWYMQHKPQPMMPLVTVSAPQVYANPQCAVPTLDYSRRPLRLDSKAIA